MPTSREAASGTWSTSARLRGTSGGGGGGGGGGGVPAGAGTPPTQNMKPQTSVGKGEGALNLIAWAGYAQPLWVKPFEQQTGCQVHQTNPNTSAEFVSLLKDG